MGLFSFFFFLFVFHFSLPFPFLCFFVCFVCLFVSYLQLWDNIIICLERNHPLKRLMCCWFSSHLVMLLGGDCLWRCYNLALVDIVTYKDLSLPISTFFFWSNYFESSVVENTSFIFFVHLFISFLLLSFFFQGKVFFSFLFLLLLIFLFFIFWQTLLMTAFGNFISCSQDTFSFYSSDWNLSYLRAILSSLPLE